MTVNGRDQKTRWRKGEADTDAISSLEMSAITHSYSPFIRLARLKDENYVPPARFQASNEVDPSQFLSSSRQGDGGSSDPVEGAKTIQDLCNVVSEVKTALKMLR